MTGFSDRVMRVINRFASVPAWTKAVPSALFDRSAWSVPAGCPEPYLYDRLFSGSEIAVGLGQGLKTASAKE